MRIAIHDGSFHADEVFAVATLELRGEPAEIVRTRDREALASADLRVDVGFRDDPSTGDYDHHQRGFAETRPNGVGYAAFGLVWRRFGVEVCAGAAAVADAVDATLVQSVDAGDTGQPLSEPLIDGVRPVSLGGLIGAFNLSWDDAATPEAEGERFAAAVVFARGVLEREIASAASAVRAASLVRAAIAAAPDPRLIEVSANAPWKSVLVPEAPEALYVIYPKRQGFGLQAVPAALGSFENRQDLPAAWAGLQDEDLAAVTGVSDAVFCHAKRFLAVAGSHAGIERLAALALGDA